MRRTDKFKINERPEVLKPARPLISQHPDELLKQGIEEIGLLHTPPLITSFIVYLEELKKWNRAYNLTALKTDRDIIIKNFLDSLLFCKVLPDTVRSVADIGTGAGFPGIPLKIMNPELRLVLVEPTGKKALFLKHLCTRLGLNDVEIINRRVEDITGTGVDAAVTRALFTIGEFTKKAGHILNKNGVLVLSKGPKIEEELRGLDMRNISIVDMVLPYEHALRHLVLVRT